MKMEGIKTVETKTAFQRLKFDQRGNARNYIRLDKLPYEAANFVRYVNFILYGSNSRIISVSLEWKSVKDFNYEDRFAKIGVNLCGKKDIPKQDKHHAETYVGVSMKEGEKPKIIYFKNGEDFRSLEEQIMRYDLSGFENIFS